MNHEIKTKNLSDDSLALLEEFAHDKPYTVTHGAYYFLHEKDYTKALEVVGCGGQNEKQEGSVTNVYFL